MNTKETSTILPICFHSSRWLWGVACAALALLSSSSTYGASRFWTGAVNGNFNTGGNWVGGVAPAAGDDLVFQPNASVTRFLVTNNFSPNRAFTSVLFQGSNYFVRGFPIVVTNGINSGNPFGPNTIDADVEIRGSQAWEGTGPLASMDINGDINLNANTLTVRANTADFFFSGIVSGTGNLVKTNVGTLRMDGAANNTYSGFTRFDGGVLELDKFGLISITPLIFTNFISIPGDLTIGDGNGAVGTDVLRLMANDQIADTSDVTVKNSGFFDLNNFDEHIASLTMQGGTIDSGTGILTLGGNLTTLADANSAIINGNLSLGGASRIFTVNSGPPGADLRINAAISSGSGIIIAAIGLTKNGAGSLFLAGTNTYTGTTTINDGQLAALADRALGVATTFLGNPAPTVINGDANLFLSNVQVTNEDLTINSDNPSGAFNASGASVWTGDIVINTNTFISSSGSLLLSGAITGPGGFTKISTGSLTLAGTNANTYSGTTTVRDGTLFLGKDISAVLDGAMSGPLIIGEDELPENTDVVRYLGCCQLPDDTDITINASGLLDLNGFGDNVRNITLNGGDIDTGAAGSILPIGDITVNANSNSIATISGRLSVLSNPIINTIGHILSPDLRIDALVIGAGGFTKNGVGEVSLTAANTFTGPVTVNDGFVEVDNSLALGSTAGGTVVHNGAVLALRFNSHVPAEPLSLEGTGQFGFGALSSSFGSNSWAGNITLTSSATIWVDAGDFLNISGAISGASFDVTKTETGTLTFSGGGANTFGTMFVNQGLLEMDKTAGVSAASPLVIGDGTNTATARNLQSSQTDGVTVNFNSRWDLNGNNDTITPLVLNDGGDVTTGTGTLTLGTAGSITVGGGPFGLTGTASVISGNLNLGASGIRTINVVERAPFFLGTDSTELIVNAAVSGAAGFNKTGAGDMSLNAANTFTGDVTVSDGELLITDNAALGTPAGGTTVSGDAQLDISGDIIVVGESLALNGVGQGTEGAIRNTGGTNTWTGPISLGRTAVINVQTNTALLFSGVMSGIAGVTKIGPGRLEYSGTASNTYSGITRVNEGSLVLSRTGADDRSIAGDLIVGDGVGGSQADLVDVVGTEAQIGSPSDVTVNSSGLLRFSIPFGEIIGSLSGEAGGIVQLNGTILLTGGNNATTVFSGAINGTGGLTKQGTGTFSLNGNCTYTGATLVNAGTLLVNANVPSDTTVATSATLGGNGRVGDLRVNNIGNLAPGTSPGSLTTANMKLDPGSNFRVELDGSVAGTGYDRVRAFGTVDLNGALLLPTKAAGYAPVDGVVHTIIENDGIDAITGTFGGRPEGSIVTLNQIDFRLSYVGGTGNDVTLTVTNIPLRFASSRVEAGNGNGLVDPNECDHLFVALENRAAATLGGITARLDSLTPGVSITQPDSAYPNIPALGFGTNTTPFQIRISPDFVCGQNVDLSLVVSATGEGTFAVPFALSSGTPGAFLTFNSTNVPKAILDLGTTNSILIVTNQFPIRKLRVSLHATHPAAGDLRFRLRSQTGVEVLLSANHGGNVPNYGNSCAVRTIFDDDAATKIAAASAPFAGTFAPEENLAAFIGENAAGIWQLFADDTVAGDTGTLQCWSLFIAPAACSDGGGECESCLATVSGTLTPASPTLPERIFRNEQPSGCGNVKLCPGGTTSGSSITAYRYNTHTFTNTGPDTCVTVVLTVPCPDPTNALISAAYLDQFLPPDLCANYLGDSGNDVEGGSLGYSFRVPAGAHFVVMVHEQNPSDVGQGCGNYTLELYGLPCPPPTLHISRVATPPNRVRLFWSTAYPEFQLQRSATLTGAQPFPFVNVGTVPVVIGGDYNVTNSATGNDDYFRLRQP